MREGRMSSRRKVLVFGLYVLAFGLVIGGCCLVTAYNIGTEYASKVPTTTQTVKLCHLDCRYLAPEIAFRLYTGFGLVVAGALIIWIMQIRENLARGK